MSFVHVKRMLLTLDLLLFAMMLGPVVLLGVAVYLVNSDFEIVNEVPDLYVIIPFVYAVISIAVSYFIFKLRIVQISKKEELYQKLYHYRTLFIIRIAILEGGAMLACIMYMLTGNSILFIVVGVLLGLMWFFRPNKDRIVKELQLTIDEENDLRAV
jgi:hypothetical protein